jgi:PGF-CTERM protein
MEILPTYFEDPVVPYVPLRPEAKFKLSNLSVPASVRTGETITIKIDITNIGEALDSTTVNIKINDTVIGFKEVTLGVGETKTVEFTHTTEDEPGTYSVEVDGKTSEYVVTPGFEVVFAIAGLLAVAYLLRRRKRKCLMWEK